MGNTDFTTMYDQVMPELPKCPAPLIDKHMRNTWIRFCHETQAWTYDLTAINIRDGVQEYRLDGLQPSYAQIDTVIKVILEDVPIEPGTGYTMANRERAIWLVSEPTADVTAGLEVQVALRPTRTSTYIDTRLYEDWEEQVAKGVMAVLMKMPGKAWSDKTQGNQYDREFRDTIAKARIQQTRGGMNKRTVARAPRAYRW